MSATRTTAHLRKKFPHFCAGGVGQKILLKAPPIVKKEMRSPLINDVSREQIERAIDITEALGINQPILALSAGAVGLMDKPPEVLTRCLPISWLVSAADDNVQSGPTRLAKLVAPLCEQSVQLLKLYAHGQLRSLECARGQCADMLLESFEVHTALLENPVDECTRAAQQLGGRFRSDSCRR
jgi:hypothetical protein